MSHQLTSEQVIIEIANNHPEITAYCFCTYTPLLDSTAKPFNPVTNIFLLPRSQLLAPQNPLVALKERWIVVDGGGVENEALGITSKIQMNDGRELHLTLIDFCDEIFGGEKYRRLRISDVRKTLSSLNIGKGYILYSGNSYHFIGEIPSNSEGYRKLLRAMQEQESIGQSWPEYQLEKGFAVLRVLACPDRDKPHAPYLIEKYTNTQIPLL